MHHLIQVLDGCQVDCNSVVLSEQVPEVPVEGEVISSSAISRDRHTDMASPSSVAGFVNEVPPVAQTSVPNSVASEETGPLPLYTTDSVAELSHFLFTDCHSLDFNIVQGSFGASGIGGLLRDHYGKVLLRFAKSVGNLDPISAELLTVKEAGTLFRKIFRRSPWSLTIESDNSLVCGWCNNPSTTPNPFKGDIAEICNLMLSIEWRISLVYREAIIEADSLGKRGISWAQHLFWIDQSLEQSLGSND
ncbi:hypothetical protein V6N12_007153 [Hibiscus sabdariffa]|uniref:RNase H type-1 domain-containing protein n=1 Tax=Hibiscus sabdariffa TaxID=183260 RepID=A0ABR2F0Y5_9ROSI